ncbi:MAG: T9SS type A sorting domain-containing protein [Bacteroidetes bacterium]|nr:T9SS type A sorting domain-containing protein [Bacteroidota bacterium]
MKFDEISGAAPNNEVLANFAVMQNYPNPFNPTTKIKYELPRSSFVTLKVFDIIGREVKVLVNAQESAGSHEVVFDANNFPSGVYIYRLTAESFADTKKMLLIK